MIDFCRAIAFGNTRFYRAISLRSIRAFIALSRPLGSIRALVALFRCAQYALLCSRLAAGAAKRYAFRPISLRSIRALVALLPLAIRAFIALFRCAQYALLSRYFATLNTRSLFCQFAHLLRQRRPEGDGNVP